MYVRQLKHFHPGEIEETLRGIRSVSLCADTTRPRPKLRFYEDADIEVWMSRYPSFIATVPCHHKSRQEFKYIIKGIAKVLVLGTDEEYEFEAGSLFIVDFGMRYCMKCMPGTLIMTFKVPENYGREDEELPIGDKLRVWRSTWSGNPLITCISELPGDEGEAAPE